MASTQMPVRARYLLACPSWAKSFIVYARAALRSDDSGDRLLMHQLAV